MEEISPLLWLARSLSGNVGSTEGLTDSGVGRGKPREELVSSSVRPQGNSSVPRGRPSNPQTRPYQFYTFERVRDKYGRPTRFLKASGIAYGERVYEWEVQEDLETKKIWCHCDCPDFTYRFEVVDAGSGFSGIRNSNGAYPEKTNPNGVPSLCKHLIQILKDPRFDEAEREYQEEKR